MQYARSECFEYVETTKTSALLRLLQASRRRSIMALHWSPYELGVLAQPLRVVKIKEASSRVEDPLNEGLSRPGREGMMRPHSGFPSLPSLERGIQAPMLQYGAGASQREWTDRQ